MQNGKRDQKITIRRRATAKSSSGADVPQEPPIEVATVWAEIGEASGGQRRESLSADALATVTLYALKIPYLAGLDETMEVVWGARVLDIVQVPDLGPRPRYMTIFAEQRR